MREILFRGKRKDDGEWIEGSYFEMPTEDTYILTSRQETKFIFRILPETVGQYTGLIDKNGKKIFEGDIIEFADCLDEQHKGVVYWRSGSYNVDCSKSDSKDECFFRLFTAYACGAKIIGNIYDNPELLGGEQNATD